MKKLTAALCFCVFFGAAAAYGEGIAEDLSRVSGQVDTSYALGMVLGSDLKQAGLWINYSAFTQGLRDSLEDRAAKIDMNEAILLVQVAYNMAVMEQTERNKERERFFLEENGRREGVVTTASGLQYEVITEGEGERPGPADTVRVNYEGSLMDGTVFDSSYDQGEPAEFPLEMVIPGWAEGILLMTVGSAYRLYIPSALAYGEQGAGGVIPPSSLIIFDVELLEIIEDNFPEGDQPGF